MNSTIYVTTTLFCMIERQLSSKKAKRLGPGGIRVHDIKDNPSRNVTFIQSSKNLHGASLVFNYVFQSSNRRPTGFRNTLKFCCSHIHTVVFISASLCANDGNNPYWKEKHLHSDQLLPPTELLINVHQIILRKPFLILSPVIWFDQRYACDILTPWYVLSYIFRKPLTIAI